MAETLPLHVLRCRECQKRQLGPRSSCRFCGQDEFINETIAGEGNIYSYTVIRVPPARFANEAPYTVVAVRFADDLTVTGRLKSDVHGDAGGGIRIGQRVRLVAQDETGYWFELSDAENAGGS